MQRQIEKYREYLFFVSTGWLIFDVTNATKSWQKDYRTNQGLRLEITELEEDGSHGQEIHPITVGLSSSRDSKPNQEV